MLRPLSLLLLLVFLAALVGCASEKQRVARYLNDLGDPDATMDASVQKLQNVPQQLQAGVELKELQANVQQARQSLNQEKQRVEALRPPESCQSLHDMTVEYLGVALSLLDDYERFLPEGARAMALMNEIRANPSRALQMRGQIEQVQRTLQDFVEGVRPKIQKAGELQKKINEERARLIKEYGITETPASPGR
ncbi:MAG TPA: hypothetical protein VNO81_14640 [Candidatus Nitrosotenuis sp.]|jgi:hypothetical protein|nr:hypothetical protein [Candidatus Nitrosotenuis sp.]